MHFFKKLNQTHPNSARVESTALATKSQNFASNSSFSGTHHAKGKEKPMCTHCGKLGHTVDKCYRRHGFPPGFKFKNKNSMAHQVSASHDQIQTQMVASGQETYSPYSPFTKDQYQKLLALIGSVSTTPQQTSSGQDCHMVNNVALPTNAVVAILFFLPRLLIGEHIAWIHGFWILG